MYLAGPAHNASVIVGYHGLAFLCFEDADGADFIADVIPIALGGVDRYVDHVLSSFESEAARTQ